MSLATIQLPWVLSQRALYFFLDCKQIIIVSTDFSYNFPILNFRIIRPVREALGHADAQTFVRTKGYDKRNGRFPRLFEDAQKSEREGKATERKCEKKIKCGK